MAVGTIYATIPAVIAAAVGIYYYDRHSGAQELGGGIRSSISVLAKTSKKLNTPLPKMAPQFDGLNCFETLVGS